MLTTTKFMYVELILGIVSWDAGLTVAMRIISAMMIGTAVAALIDAHEKKTGRK